MTSDKAKPNINTVVIPICTSIMLAALGWVGHTASTTHDSVIKLETEQVDMVKNISDIKTAMVTKTDLSVELLKLQIPKQTSDAKK